MKLTKYITLFFISFCLPLPVLSQESEEELPWGFNLTRNKNENTAAISVAGKEDITGSVTNPGNGLYGKLAGLIVSQGTNVVWSDDPTLMIRGAGSLNNNTPLILVDGFERPLSSLDTEDIESVEVIKDAAALALYGMRGANGVVIVRTKRGTHDDLRVKVSYQYGFKKPFRVPEMADGLSYAMALNEARYLDGLSPAYSQFDLNDLRTGNNPELLPNVDWVGEVLRNIGHNHQLNAAFTGGSQWIRYYTSINYMGDRGFMNSKHFEPEYKSQMSWNRLSARANLDIDVTASTLLKLNVMGQIYQHHRPSVNYPTLFSNLYNVPSTAFPIRTSTGNWGGNYIHTNPVADLVGTGYTDGNDRALYADMRLIQDLSALLPGLSAEVALGYDNQASYWEGESKTYESENVLFTRDKQGTITDIERTVYGTAGSLLYSSQLGYQNQVTTFDGKVNYNTAWNNTQTLSSSLIYHMEENSLKGRNNTYRRQSIIANALYGLKEKYYLNATVTHAGSSVMSDNNKFRTFPALSAAWIASSEQFLSSNPVIDYLKIRASWGMSGSDLFAYELDKQFFTQGGSSYYFGVNNTGASGTTEGRLPNLNLNCEMSYKTNVGFDINLWKQFSLTADLFYEKRTNILVSSTNAYSSAIGVTTAMVNDGEVKNYGIDIAADWSKQVGNWGYLVKGNFLFARNEIVQMNEGYQPHDYLKQTGRRVGQFFGLEAIGYFKDDADIAASPTQSFSQVRPGDIKYKDQNNDGIIDDYDRVALGYSTFAPEIYYGFTLGLSYKNLSFRADFQGVANHSLVKSMSSMYLPLRNNTTVSNHYLENRWTPGNDNAAYPRLTTLDNQNNFRNNSVWLANGAFLKLRNIEVNYRLPQSVCRFIHATGINVFARGMNLFSVDNIKALDPELIYASYPSYSSYHFGINLEF